MPELGPACLRQIGDYFVNGRHLQLTLRELRGNFQQPVTLAALAAVAVVVGISGPFDTINAFALPQRLAYWAVVVPITYAAGFWGSLLVGPVVRNQRIALRIAGRSFGAVCLLKARSRARTCARRQGDDGGHQRF